MLETYHSFLRPIKRCGSYLALSYINSEIIHSQKWKLLEMSHTEVRLAGACAREFAHVRPTPSARWMLASRSVAGCS